MALPKPDVGLSPSENVARIGAAIDAIGSLSDDVTAEADRRDQAIAAEAAARAAAIAQLNQALVAA